MSRPTRRHHASAEQLIGKYTFFSRLEIFEKKIKLYLYINLNSNMSNINMFLFMLQPPAEIYNSADAHADRNECFEQYNLEIITKYLSRYLCFTSNCIVHFFFSFVLPFFFFFFPDSIT
ncbi:hypothetical protein PUN28_017623 [Cardiocondyla obscurior]|uniref:Uncharacterized protein n=1 Tax=Cardiocondyla obscurior TaxID=286306 RepID=A0AAW2EID9_9HYME